MMQEMQETLARNSAPGEDEHKIMQLIREMDRNYRTNTRHCTIYGQDANLIMLGPVMDEPHFTILREGIDFNSYDSSNNNKNSLKAVKNITKESDFQLLLVSVLREYLAPTSRSSSGISSASLMI